MNYSIRSDFPRFGEPGRYRIVVNGSLSESRAESLWGMKVVESEGGIAAFQTTLVGELCDQAALAGVLNTLNHMGHSILSLQLIKDQVKE